MFWSKDKTKCDLCKRQNDTETSLCSVCGEVIVRLLTIKEREQAAKECKPLAQTMQQPVQAIAPDPYNQSNMFYKPKRRITKK